MLHIIFFILKITGLLVLTVTGLILTAALLVLLVPVRYRAEGFCDGKVKGKIRITWLLHILSVTVGYEEDFIVKVRFFGFSKRKPRKMDDELKEAGEMAVQAMEVTEPEPPAKALEVKAEIEDKFKENKESQPPPPPIKKSKKKKRLDAKLKSFFQRICVTIKTLKYKNDKIHAWIANNENRKTAKLLFRQGGKFLHHILPRRGKGNITFGFDDPYLTGQVLTYASIIYPLCHKHLNLYPVFDRTVFTAEGRFRGRVRTGTVLIIGLRMLLDRNFRRLLKGWHHKGGIGKRG